MEKGRLEEITKRLAELRSNLLEIPKLRWESREYCLLVRELFNNGAINAARMNAKWYIQYVIGKEDYDERTGKDCDKSSVKR